MSFCVDFGRFRINVEGASREAGSDESNKDARILDIRTNNKQNITLYSLAGNNFFTVRTDNATVASSTGFDVRKIPGGTTFVSSALDENSSEHEVTFSGLRPLKVRVTRRTG